MTRSVRVIGAGRAGGSLARALGEAGWRVEPPLGRGDDPAGAAAGVDLLVIATPDAAVPDVAARVTPVASTVVAHLAGSLGLDELAPHPRRAALHPLVALPEPGIGAQRLRGAWFAVAGDDLVTEVVAVLGGRWFRLADEHRATYHAAACVASNHLVALLGQVERLAGSVGVPLDAYLDLTRASLDNVAELGPAAALTGPAARGDTGTIARHVRALPPGERPAYRAMADEASRLAGRRPEDRNREMRTITTIAELRGELDAARAAGRSVGFVPTMGYLHEGHASLMRRARADTDVVVASVFVNPLQFGEGEDLDAYPRDLARDTALCEEAGVDLLFAPPVEEMYPRPVLTTVSVAEVSEPLEGRHRPTHFAGVATVVAKLLGIVGPCRIYFGAKDYQQVAVVARMVADLSLPAEVVACPTVRERDGLAMSSRNAYLDAEERATAPVLHRALQSGRAAILAGERDPAAVRDLMAQIIEAEPLARLDYAEVVDAHSFARPDRLAGDLRLLVAARFGRARLIDNVGVTV
ncbi:MAG TPA: pantoate--beta-alanine ligase [Acidimicrobiales bacterium]